MQEISAVDGGAAGSKRAGDDVLDAAAFGFV
jgi:hypothetical protein